ncbi:MAG: acyl-CoA thioesterase [Planctomycetes bacterium]|nr:acyl-CoA thioesterase [Planctomycetota bacterium]
MPDPAEHSYRFEVTLPVRWRDVDAHGVVNNAVYASLIEQARYEYFTQLDLMKSRELFPFVLLSQQLRFHAPGRAGMELRVAVATVRLGRSSFDMVARITCGETLIVTGTSTCVYVDDDVKSVPIPDADRERMRVHEAGHLIES